MTANEVICTSVDMEKLFLKSESEMNQVSAMELKDKKMNDVSIGPVYQAVERGTCPSRREVALWSRPSKSSYEEF